MKTILTITACMLLASCATKYEVKKCTVITNIETCSTAKITSRREFPEGMQLRYNSTTGDFEFFANKVTEKANPLEEIGSMAVIELLKKVK